MAGIALYYANREQTTYSSVRAGRICREQRKSANMERESSTAENAAREASVRIISKSIIGKSAAQITSANTVGERHVVKIAEQEITVRMVARKASVKNVAGLEYAHMESRSTCVCCVAGQVSVSTEDTRKPAKNAVENAFVRMGR
jgi:hypothetical protein